MNASWLLRPAISLRNHVIARRGPDYEIGGSLDPYMRRWWLIPRNRWFNIYLHCFKRSDDDRAFHDHPWWNISFLIHGSYIEHTPAGSSVRVSGDVVFRRATASHRIELHNGDCWSIFITGRRIREWGFYCPKGWVHWKIFTNSADGGQTIGRGCGEDL